MILSIIPRQAKWPGIGQVITEFVWEICALFFCTKLKQIPFTLIILVPEGTFINPVIK